MLGIILLVSHTTSTCKWPRDIYSIHRPRIAPWAMAWGMCCGPVGSFSLSTAGWVCFKWQVGRAHLVAHLWKLVSVHVAKPLQLQQLSCSRSLLKWTVASGNHLPPQISFTHLDMGKATLFYLHYMYCSNRELLYLTDWKAGLKLNIQKTKIMASGPIISWQIDGKTMKTVRDIFWLKKSLQMVTAAMKLKDTCSLEEKLWPT